jgi:hypothetical protein
MLFVPRPNVIDNDAGFSVEMLGRTGLRYVENAKAVRIDSEVLAGPNGLAIYSSSITHWDPPHSAEAIDEETKRRIVENIRAAFCFRGFDIEVLQVQDSPPVPSSNKP